MFAIVENGRVIGVVPRRRQNIHGELVSLPDDYDPERLGEYILVNGVLRLPAVTLVTMRQLRLALHDNGFGAETQSFIDGFNARKTLAWGLTINVSRNNTIVKDLRAHLGITNSQMDQIFEDAANIGSGF